MPRPTISAGRSRSTATRSLFGAAGASISASYHQGAAYAFARTGASHRTETGKLIASGGARDDGLGSSVAIDGDTVVTAAPLRRRRRELQPGLRVDILSPATPTTTPSPTRRHAAPPGTSARPRNGPPTADCRRLRDAARTPTTTATPWPTRRDNCQTIADRTQADQDADALRRRVRALTATATGLRTAPILRQHPDPGQLRRRRRRPGRRLRPRRRQRHKATARTPAPPGTPAGPRNATTDRDSDGCRDASEDTDDDGDTMADGSDDCPTAATSATTPTATAAGDSARTPTTTTTARPTAPTAAPRATRLDLEWHTDRDSDGCRDSTEDADDDNDTVADVSDNCRASPQSRPVDCPTIPAR